MNDQVHYASSHAVYSIKLHVVFVTKCRRKILDENVLEFLRDAFDKVLTDWRCTLIEFGGEDDHVHMLIDIHPALNVSTLINNLKTASSRRAGRVFADHLARFYRTPSFWHRAYFVGSCGGVTIDTIKNYVAQQGTKEKT